VAHNLDRAFQDLMHEHVAHKVLDLVTREISIPSVQLKYLITGIEASIGTEKLRSRMDSCFSSSNLAAWRSTSRASQPRGNLREGYVPHAGLKQQSSLT
jgi:hypothetical protein